MTKQYSHDELVQKIKTPGWKTTRDDGPVTGTLEDVLNITHLRRAGRNAPDAIQEVDTEVELTLIQIENLWRYLGLPV